MGPQRAARILRTRTHSTLHQNAAVSNRDCSKMAANSKTTIELEMEEWVSG